MGYRGDFVEYSWETKEYPPGGVAPARARLQLELRVSGTVHLISRVEVCSVQSVLSSEYDGTSVRAVRYLRAADNVPWFR